ncbi:hypothetical protein CNYM01_13980 [Colletotrichum nymphaeae SA-01]|uniref:Nucleoside phosphorylase domain-containing protein n=1 Tax=Colletotrichum nymphaeae SA-01 TaxID=1460502 RepID=A0A135U0Y6_9PEZI|nr:hypothetical protein CNYM01_13980 [Colletotrichum nymphaeae SA-01]
MIRQGRAAQPHKAGGKRMMLSPPFPAGDNLTSLQEQSSPSHLQKSLNRDDYKVAWICPLEVEQIAAMEMLDEEHEALPQPAADHNVYSLGSINGHNVVITGLHQPGNCPAATVVAQMRMTFPKLRFGLLVGIGGGVPVQTDDGMIRLGHVVVSKPAGEHSGAVQYDHGKAKDGLFQRTGALAPPPTVLLNAAQALAVRRARMANDPLQLNVRRINTSLRNLQRFQFPGGSNDHLYPPYYSHIQAADDDDTFVVVHRGTIASGELVVKTAELRDTLAQRYGLLCFEMEAAGALADFPCMVVRGISDYCDSHKNDQWHGYAAAVAAAYARQLFFHMPINEVQGGVESKFKLSSRLPGAAGVSRFIGRADELECLHKALEWVGERRTAVLHGLGGMGKTQLSIEYMKRHRMDYSAMIWLNARDETSLKQSFQQAARQISREHPALAYIQSAIINQDLDETAEAVKRWLDEVGNDRWLVIYDNYDDVRLDRCRGTDHGICRVVKQGGTAGGNTSQPAAADSKAYDIRPYFPQTDHGAVVITTRSSTVKLGQLIQVSKLVDIDDSLAILESTSSRVHLTQDADAHALARRLDGLPLALSTAGAYLRQLSINCADYLQLYNESWLRLQKESPHLLDYDQTLYSTWEVSFNHIQQQSRDAAMLLRLWAYFDNEDVWYELLQKGGSDGPVWLQKMTEDRFRFNTAMRILCEHGLAEADPAIKESGVGSRGYSVHGCVHAWMIHVLNTGVDEERSWTAMRCVASHVPSDEQEKYWMVQRRLLHHADRCMTRTLTQMAEGKNAWMFYNLGVLYSDQDRIDKAEAMYVRALQGEEKAWGPDHMSTLNTVKNLGIVYSDQGQLNKAEAMYERALQGKEKAWGSEHTSALNTVKNLGNLYSDQGRLKEAEAMYERALKGEEKACGPNHKSTLGTVNNLGSLYKDQGRLKEAEAMLERALHGKEKALGPDHTSTLDTIGNFGLVYSDQSRFIEAKAMLERALQGYEKTLGQDAMRTSIPILNTLESLGSVHEKIGEKSKAILYYQRAQTGFSLLLGSKNERFPYVSDKIGSLQLCTQEIDVSLSVVKPGRGLKARWKRLTEHLKGM